MGKTDFNQPEGTSYWYKNTKREDVRKILFSHFEFCLFWHNPISEGVLEEVNMPNACGYVGVERINLHRMQY